MKCPQCQEELMKVFGMEYGYECYYCQGVFTEKFLKERGNKKCN